MLNASVMGLGIVCVVGGSDEAAALACDAKPFVLRSCSRRLEPSSQLARRISLGQQSLSLGRGHRPGAVGGVMLAGVFAEAHCILGSRLGHVVHCLDALRHHGLDRLGAGERNAKHLGHAFDQVFLLSAGCIQVGHHLAKTSVWFATGHLWYSMFAAELLCSSPALGRGLSHW